MNKDIMNRFCFHKPDEAGVKKMKGIRMLVRALAYEIDHLCPESPEKATALSQLATVMMNANSAIVQGYPIDTNDLTDAERASL